MLSQTSVFNDAKASSSSQTHVAQGLGSRPSKRGPQPGSIIFSITPDLVRNAHSQAPPQTSQIQDRGRGAVCALLLLRVTGRRSTVTAPTLGLPTSLR